MADEQQDLSPEPFSRVLVAESDPNVRAALVMVLERMPHFRLVAQCESLNELVRDALELHPEVILVDLELSGFFRIGDDLGALRSAVPGAVMIALSTRDEQRQLALQAGATAFVCKGESPLKLLNALDAGVIRSSGGRPA
jgi:DNA-binding NarL/FixJ family response regulator